MGFLKYSCFIGMLRHFASFDLSRTSGCLHGTVSIGIMGRLLSPGYGMWHVVVCGELINGGDRDEAYCLCSAALVWHISNAP